MNKTITLNDNVMATVRDALSTFHAHLEYTVRSEKESDLMGAKQAFRRRQLAEIWSAIQAIDRAPRFREDGQKTAL